MTCEGDVSILTGRQIVHDKRTMLRVFEDQLNDVHILEKTAIICQRKKITFRELNESANKIGKSILSRIIKNDLRRNGDGDYIIAVCMPPSDRLLVTLLAIWKSGAAYLPLDTTFPKQRVQHILGESRPVMVIYDETANAHHFSSFEPISFEKLLEETKFEPPSNIKDQERLMQTTRDLAIVLYTSGSTGIPKGVLIPHSIIRNRIDWQLTQFPFALDEDICAMKTSLTFVDCVCEIWAPLTNGRAILVVPKHVTVDPEKLTGLLEDYKIQRLVLVPTLLHSLLLYLSMEDNGEKLRGLKLWISSGEPLPVNLAKEFFRHFSEKGGHVLCNFYGSTEVMGDVTYQSITSEKEVDRYQKVPMGIPLNNTIIYLLDESMQPVKNGQQGELWVSGLNLAAGYVNGRDPDRFIRNPLSVDRAYARLYRTGDFAKVEDGVLYYEGRSDSQVKVRGHRVDLAEVEKALLSIPDVDKGVVLCYRAGDVEQALLAFVTSQGDHNVTGLYLEGKLHEQLPTYMLPQVIMVDQIPLLVNGKVDRQLLLKMYETTNNNNDDTTLSLDIDYSGVCIEKMAAAEALFTTIGAVIGRSARRTLSLESNFYELGGNSLNSIVTITRLRERGYRIGITEFITAKNLGEILSIMKSNDLTKSHDVTETEAPKMGPTFIAEPLQDNHKDAAIKMIVASFYEKADLEQWMKPDIKENDYNELLHCAWDALVAAGLSFVVRAAGDTSCSDLGPGSIVGISLNLDARDEPEVDIDNALIYIFEFLEYLEGPVRDSQLPEGKGQIMHSFMMATRAELSSADNVAVIAFMERHTECVGRQQRFSGVFTTNTSPLTQQLATGVLGYQVLADYQVNEYISHDGKRIFGRAPDDQRVLVCWKPLSC